MLAPGLLTSFLHDEFHNAPGAGFLRDPQQQQQQAFLQHQPPQHQLQMSSYAAMNGADSNSSNNSNLITTSATASSSSPPTASSSAAGAAAAGVATTSSAQDHMYHTQMMSHPHLGGMGMGPMGASCVAAAGMMSGAGGGGGGGGGGVVGDVPPGSHHHPLSSSASLVPKFPPQNFEVPDISLSNSLTATEDGGGGSGGVGVLEGGSQGRGPGTLFENILTSSAEVMMDTSGLGGMPPSQGQVTSMSMGPPQAQPALTTINQSQLAGFLGGGGSVVGVGGGPGTQGPKKASPVRGESSEDSDDSLPLAQLVNLKRAAAGAGMSGVGGVSAPTPAKEAAAPAAPKASPVKRQRGGGGKKKKKKDPNEPQKPVSAYSLFFRDTQSAIKGQNPSASFGEVSRIVASMWDGLDPTQKEVYKKRTEMAKKEYLKQLAAYRASQVSQSAAVAEESSPAAPEEKSPSPPSVQNITLSPPPASSQPPSMQQQQQQQQHQQQMQQQQQQLQQQQQQMQQQLQQQQQQQQKMQIQQQTMAQAMQHQSPPQYSSGGGGGGEMMVVSSTPNQHPPHPSQVDPTMSAAHDSGLFSPGMLNQSPAVLCVRDGCQNMAIENPGWDAEYCSNECVVTHCRDIFTAWVAARGGASSFPVK